MFRNSALEQMCESFDKQGSIVYASESERQAPLHAKH